MLKPMSYESEFIVFLHEVLEMRVKDISEQVQQQADIGEINQRTLDFMENITDEDVRAVLLHYEELKNEYNSLIMPLMYNSGIKDLIMLYRILQSHPLS